MKHVTTVHKGNGRLRTHLRKCNKEFARLDDIERANRNGIPIPENSMGVGGSNMVQNGIFQFGISCEKIRLACNWIFKTKIKARIIEFKNRCKECGLEYRKVPKEVCTRWNSLFEMLQVAYIYQELIYANLEIKDDETPSVEDCKSSIYIKARELYNTYKSMEKNIPIVEPPSCKLRSDDTDD
ncbi:hypothetical protein H5410_006617 [Solanum commersonii]|uniref:Uncharacterized protein n=1 Tax=Solanum commersonii TaxID=4109 RepID=A0A9J6ABV5_SOLCO|nr:hypothetical protein H5410_006617 [Solanum commersonii]